MLFCFFRQAEVSAFFDRCEINQKPALIQSGFLLCRKNNPLKKLDKPI
jgi:hypothetical protein